MMAANPNTTLALGRETRSYQLRTSGGSFALKHRSKQDLENTNGYANKPVRGRSGTNSGCFSTATTETPMFDAAQAPSLRRVLDLMKRRNP
jgi:hypothetical protein